MVEEKDKLNNVSGNIGEEEKLTKDEEIEAIEEKEMKG